LRLTDFFGRFMRRGDVVSVIGCGGKTSLLWALAEQKRRQKTLVTTSTHTQKPDGAGMFDCFFDGASFGDFNGFKPRAGITFAGNTGASGHSVSSLPLPLLEKIIPFFDYVFIEADGSRTLPLKAWAAYEPVITDSTTITVGILPLWPLGKPVSPELVHRLSLFTALTGAKEGGVINPEHYVTLISGPETDGIAAHSMFSISKGKKILFFNQVEDENQLEKARRLTAMLPSEFKAGLQAVIAGSIRENRMELL
jgi:probable selenium-dependent hydroxylase accessory protein YqeC